MLIYLICLLILGLPVMTMEFSVGRAARTSPIYMYQKLEKPGHKWGIFGIVSLIGNITLMAFYTVVCGWLIYYFVKFLTGQNQSFGFTQMIQNPSVNVSYLLVTVIVAFLILSFDLQGGLERITKYMMTSLLVLMLVLAVHSLTLSGAADGVKFYLVPDFSKINGSVIVGAMNQAFFTLSVGMGGMAIFGSYIDKKRSLMGESATIILLDTLVAVLAGIIMFPACFTYGLEVNAGPSLLFDTMADVFNHMAGGRIWGTLFFLFMVFAALSTVLGVCENILAMIRELTGLSRKKGCIVCGTGILAIDHRLDHWLSIADEIRLMAQDGTLDGAAYAPSALSPQAWAERGVSVPGCPYQAARPVKTGPEEVVLSLRGLRVSQDGREVLRDVNADFFRGRIHVIVGPSGSGKSTLFGALSGLYRYQGSARLEGMELSRHRRRLTGRMGFVTQSPQDQFVADTVLDEVTVSLRHSAGAGDPAAGAEEVLRRIQLWRFRRLSPYMLSQGQQRRLGVAALLAYDCQVLVCDEPTYAQDRGRTAAIMDALQQEVVERGLTLILSTHDRALAQDYADILYELKEGSLYEVAQSRL